MTDEALQALAAAVAADPAVKDATVFAYIARFGGGVGNGLGFIYDAQPPRYFCPETRTPFKLAFAWKRALQPNPDRVVVLVQINRSTDDVGIKVFHGDDADPWLNEVGDEDALAELARPNSL